MRQENDLMEWLSENDLKERKMYSEKNEKVTVTGPASEVCSKR